MVLGKGMWYNDMKIVDTNIVLRYLLNDHKTLSPQAYDIMTTNKILILSQVVAELLYVLKNVYQSTREEIVATLFSIAEMDNVQFENSDIVFCALDEFKATNLDFVDTLLFAYKKIENRDVIIFDKKSNSRIENTSDKTPLNP